MPAGRARQVADLLRLSLVVGAVAFALVDGIAAGWGMGLAAVTATTVRLIKPRAIADLTFTSLLAADFWLTSLGAFDNFNHGDHIGHLLLAAAVTVVLFDVVRRESIWGAAKVPRVRALALIAAGLTVLLGLAWEVVELASDAFIGTDMSLGLKDTVGDLAGDLIGASLAALGLIILQRRRRRKPTAPQAGFPQPRLTE